MGLKWCGVKGSPQKSDVYAVLLLDIPSKASAVPGNYISFCFGNVSNLRSDSNENKKNSIRNHFINGHFWCIGDHYIRPTQ